MYVESIVGWVESGWGYLMEIVLCVQSVGKGAFGKWADKPKAYTYSRAQICLMLSLHLIARTISRITRTIYTNDNHGYGQRMNCFALLEKYLSTLYYDIPCSGHVFSYEVHEKISITGQSIMLITEPRDVFLYTI